MTICLEESIMPSNDPSGSSATTPPGADDLTRIRGISPKTANRLYEAGILTFAKLANMSPDEIVTRIGSPSGVSVESVTKRDWIGQAREMASQMGQEAEASAADGHLRADFAVKLQLNADNTVSQTHVMHMQSGGEAIWDGWIGDRLIDFFVQRADLSLAGPEAKAPAVIEVAPPPTKTKGATEVAAEVATETTTKARPPAGADELKGQARLRDLAPVQAQGTDPSRSLSSGQPFDVRLLLDLSEVESPQDAPLGYKAAIYAKSLEAKGNHIVGEMQGTVTPAEEVALKFEGAHLPKGVYRLQATVTLTLPAKSNGALTSSHYLDGGLLQVR
jgi:predicted flap endonuclease-1-like 5' DNA nuclease